MASSFSTEVTPSESGTVTATITADNADPKSVWDEAYMTTSSGRVSLKYVEGSAKIYNDWESNGSILPSSLFSEEGTPLGCDELNGIIPGDKPNPIFCKTIIKKSERCYNCYGN